MLTIGCPRQTLLSRMTIVAVGCIAALGAAPVAAQEIPLDPYGAPAPPPLSAPIDPYGPAAPGATYAPYGRPAPGYDPYTVRRAPPPDECSECAEVPPVYAPLPYRPAPPAFELRRQPQRSNRLLGAGLGLFTSAWALTSLTAAATDNGLLAIPLAGPIIEIVHLDRTYEPGFGRTVLSGILVFDAMVQTAGLVMAIVGGTTGGTHHRHAPPRATWTGAGVAGRF